MSKYIIGSRAKMLKDIASLEEDLRIIPMHRESLKDMSSWTEEELAKYRWLLQDWKSREGSGGSNG